MTFGQNPTYIFPDEGHTQGIQTQVQPSTIVGTDYVS